MAKTISSVEVDADVVLPSITVPVRIHGIRRALVRTQIAHGLMRLARWVAPFEIEVIDEVSDGETN